MKRTDISLGSFIGLMRSSSKLEKIVKKDVSTYQLNITEFSVMELLFHQGRQTTQTIKDKILIASSSTTYVIDQLEKKDYVERMIDERDRRITYVSLSEKGHKLIQEIFPTHAETISDCFSDLNTEELEQFFKTLAKLNRALDKK